MSMRCDVCGKEPHFGRSVARLGKNAMNRRIKGRSSRRFVPNIQSVRAIVNGARKRMRVCTSCIKAGKVARAVS
jgi:large subunit ribosomal protein L28